LTKPLTVRQSLSLSYFLSWSVTSSKFFGFLAFISISTVFWTLLGFYLDQVIPSEYGVAKPWNFLCGGKKKDKKTVEIEMKAKKPKNFEEVTDQLKK
jgi:hypothetical protein